MSNKPTDTEVEEASKNGLGLPDESDADRDPPVAAAQPGLTPEQQAQFSPAAPPPDPRALAPTTPFDEAESQPEPVGKLTPIADVELAPGQTTRTWIDEVGTKFFQPVKDKNGVDLTFGKPIHPDYHPERIKKAKEQARRETISALVQELEEKGFNSAKQVIAYLKELL